MSISKSGQINKYVYFWMILGIILIYVQIIIGGVTRLTGSGLSITKWEIVTGTLPPMSVEGWEEAFAMYRDTPQYQKLNEGMSISDFKFIYFWEYFHRLWARGMGLIFIVPFLIFWFKGWLSRQLTRRLLIVLVLAGLVGVFGWIMVASGLVERPWVNAYKLSIHLSLALLVMGYLWWVTLDYRFALGTGRRIRKMKWILILLCCQLFLGGIMSGMKASLSYPDFPDYAGSWIPSVLTDSSQWNVDNIVNYDKSSFAPALAQFLHRNVAYLLIISMLCVYWTTRRHWKRINLRWSPIMLICMLITQILLGVAVLLGSIGSIPVLWGVMHQAVAILIFITTVYIYYFSIRR